MEAKKMKPESQTINKDMKISELVQKYPECVEILMEFGLHCIGCHASGEETLEQGFKAHGMDDEEIKKIVEELNKSIWKKKN